MKINLNELVRDIHTVDGNSDTFSQGVAIGADERGDLSERIDLEVFWRHTVRRGGLDKLKIKLVCLRHGTKHG